MRRVLFYWGSVPIYRLSRNAVSRPSAGPGRAVSLSLGAYGAGRIVLESTRDKQHRVSRINLAQAISTGFVAISLVGFAIVWWRSTP